MTMNKVGTIYRIFHGSTLCRDNDETVGWCETEAEAKAYCDRIPNGPYSSVMQYEPMEHVTPMPVPRRKRGV